MRGYFFIIGILIIIVSALVTLNVFFQSSLQLDMATQFNKQQLLLARSIANTISSHISGMKEEVSKISYKISEKDSLSKEDFISLVKGELRHKGIVRADAVFLDERRDVQFYIGDSDLIKRYLPELLKGSRIKEGESRIIELPSTLAILSPVYKKGHHTGTFFFLFRIDDIGKRFLTDIKSGTRGYAWMMDDKGNLLYHPTQPEMVGKNLYITDRSCFKCHRSFELEKRILEEKGENFGVYVAPTGEDKVLAYSTADIGPSKWIVAVSAPYSEVTLAIQRSMKLYSWLIISIFATTTIAAAMLIMINRKRVQAEERARHQEELERYAKNLEKEVAMRTMELSSEKEKLNTIVSAIGSGILLMNKHGKIEWANQKMKEIVGVDINGKYCEEICPNCTPLSSYKGKNIQTEILTNLFGERDKYFQITTAPIKDENGEVHSYIRLIQDVTEMKKLEEQMMHSEKMASLGRLTAGIAHEIGNPLTSVFSFVQILKEIEEDEFKRESLETIYFHIERIANILKQLSGFSKTPPLEFRSWNINGLIETALSLIQYDKRAKDVRIIRELSPEVPEIITDGNQLSQVFINIILNAFDAMPEGGSLTLRSLVQNGDLIIEFEDTGVGISEENLSRIFDPFYTTKEKGTGLGLAVSYSIIKKLNGSLTVKSEPKKGSKFTIILPINGAK